MRNMRLFYLYRKDDESGVSGLGYVAEGVVFSNGKCVLSWRTKLTSTTVYESFKVMEQIHGHGGKTITIWDDQDLVDKYGTPHLCDGAHWINGKTGYSEGSMCTPEGEKPSEYLRKFDERISVS